MKKNIVKVILLALTLVLIFGSVNAFAYKSYDTYTYSIDGHPLQSPTAYDASDSFNSYDIGLVEMTGKSLSEATDLSADEDGNLYIADKKNNRVVILNKYYKVTKIIENYVDEYGNECTFNQPKSVFISRRSINNIDDPWLGSYIYVCDTENARVVVFDHNYDYIRTITCPETPLLLPEEFKPLAVAVDKYGRVFIVSETGNKGVIVLSGEGEFTGFIGAQKVASNPLEEIWQQFQTEEQKEMAVKKISVSFNNIAVDSDGFVYVTNNKIDKAQQYGSIASKTATYSPVKKLNSMGKEIMKRNGFFDPGGEVITDSLLTQKVSSIVDVTLGPEGSWTILDDSRSRLFTYDQDGNLLFAFGDKGSQLGNGEKFVASAYQYVDGVYRLVCLDSASVGFKITVFEPTDYCDTIISALRNQNEHNYDASIDYWQDLLTSNNNFDLAYIGIGKALHNQGKYDEAYTMLQTAYETNYAEKAFGEMRKELIGDWILVLVGVVIVLVVLLVKFLGMAKKKNKATSLKVGRKTYWEELIYACHLIFHPFDGFWDLKHEQRGSVRAATTFLGVTILAFFYNSISQGYFFNTRGVYSTIFTTILSVLVPIALWVVGNWCLTTLFDGEGSLKDIYISTCYSLAPLPLFIIVSTIMSNIMTTSEGSMVTLVSSIGFVWVGILLFFGTQVTHDYSMGKNVITILGTIVAMVIIMFVAILFSNLVIKMVTFVVSIISEIANRA